MPVVGGGGKNYIAGTGITLTGVTFAIDTAVLPRLAVANQFDAAQTIDVTGTEALLVRQDADANDLAAFDTTNLNVLLTRAGIGATQTNYGLALVNPTAAAAGAQQYSMPLRWRGYGWKTDATAASQPVDFRAFVRPIEGAAAPTGAWDLQAAVNDGAYADLLTVLTNGRVGIGTTAPGYKWDVRDNTLDYVAYIRNDRTGGAPDGLYISLAEWSTASNMIYATSGAVAHRFRVDGFANMALDVVDWNVHNKLDVLGGAAIGTYAGATAAPSNGLIVSGSVGVGTTGPDRSLDVLNATNPQLRLTHTDGSVYVDLQGDSNGDLVITPSGGYLKFGTHAAIAAETLQGYITIRDAGGTLRKIGVVA